MEKLKISKELQKVIKAIDNYIKKHEGNAQFIASFCTFDKKNEIIEDRIFAFGVKDCLSIAVKDLKEHLNNEKEDFVNW